MQFSIENRNMEIAEKIVCKLIIVRAFVQPVKIWHRIFSQIVSIFFYRKLKKKYVNFIKMKKIMDQIRGENIWGGGGSEFFFIMPCPPNSKLQVIKFLILSLQCVLFFRQFSKKILALSCYKIFHK